MHVEIAGNGPRLVLVHGSVTPGWMTWNAQRSLASRFTLVVALANFIESARAPQGRADPLQVTDCC